MPSCTPPGTKTTYWLPETVPTPPSMLFHRTYHALHPSRPQDDVSSSAQRAHAAPRLLESFHLAMVVLSPSAKHLLDVAGRVLMVDGIGCSRTSINIKSSPRSESWIPSTPPIDFR
ncbi:hypothetical protein K443DRAFT_15299 [Laccaria amethystina LaAM-08-1]|uniref:Uncharacterized protein n=1 Tax=Laccaria amethystina LaAM-08-1 TaxID=1095629 RepID=A0A0C9WYA5_9AGAR|nr:hypothetical protein K443DRAFT_15299 [Laccaria amethystina LaAM-08-1]